MKEIIEKESGVQLNGFPKGDFDKVEEMLKDNAEIEVWLMKGMGRHYLVGILPGQNNYSLPIQRKLCVLSR